jgi:hypothetical protein
LRRRLHQPAARAGLAAWCPHPQEESLSRAIGAGLLHLDDPDRLRATAQLFGAGKRWRHLPEALGLLWQASAWRDELRQLLELLAERTDRRLHPLPWALPVPLRVHGRYSRAEIEAAFGILHEDAPWIHREGVPWHERSPLLPLHPHPRPCPRPLLVPLGERPIPAGWMQGMGLAV